MKYFDLFTIKKLEPTIRIQQCSSIFLCFENTFQSYTHYNQALAHPLGANFYEAVGIINYRYKDFFIQAKGNYAVKGNDSLNYNFGGNVFKSDNTFPSNQQLEDIQTTQGLKTTIIYQDIHIGYLVNPSTNFNIVVGLSNRTEITKATNKQTQFVYFGIRNIACKFLLRFLN